MDSKFMFWILKKIRVPKEFFYTKSDIVIDILRQT